jgi:deazaflavin-dependent oxidoreductase (nitroreductase family)
VLLPFRDGRRELLESVVDIQTPDHRETNRLPDPSLCARSHERPAVRTWPDVRERTLPALAGKMVWLPEHYQRPGWFTTNVFNRLVAALTRVGVSVYGSRVLEVKGRKSGEWRQTPVNLLRYVDTDYLVSPRGHTQWVKNLRASNKGRLRVGRRTEPFTAVEVADDDKPPLLRAYLKKWKFEVGVFFAGVGPGSSDEELRRIAPDHPVFRLTKS